MCWCVVQVRAGCELAAAGLLQKNLDLNVYLPEVMQRWHGKTQLGPLFPGYLFVRDDLGCEALAHVDGTPGCGHLVRMGSRLMCAGDRVLVPDDVVQQLQAKVSRLNQVGGLPAHNLHPGDSVQIITGPMQGLSAVFQGPLTPAARIQVLLHFLGREQTVMVATDNIEPCAPAAPPKGQRRTRGHGRYIHSAQPPAMPHS